MNHRLAVMASLALTACSTTAVRSDVPRDELVRTAPHQDPKPVTKDPAPQTSETSATPTDTGPVPQAVKPESSKVELKRPTYQSAFAQSSFIDHIQPYEPIYFASAPFDRLKTRLQFSMKYKLLNEDGPIARNSDIAEHLYLGFSMRSFWDLGDSSSPFFDTAYRPSFFYLNDAMGKFGNSGRFGFQAGFEHESNGKGGDESRSLNKLFVQPLLTFALDSTWTLHLAPRAWVYVFDMSDNADIADYRGHAELLARIIDEDGFALATTFTMGDRGHPSLLADLTYPMNKLFWHNLDMYLQFQFFTGWGETLRTYNEHSPTEFRIGFMLVR